MRAALKTIVIYATGAIAAGGLVFSALPAVSAQTVEEVVVTGHPKNLPETASYHVSYADIDLATPEGVKEANRRIRVAAEFVCGQLNSGLDVGECTRDAVRNASHKIDQAKAKQPHPFKAGPSWVAPPGKQ